MRSALALLLLITAAACSSSGGTGPGYGGSSGSSGSSSGASGSATDGSSGSASGGTGGSATGGAGGTGPCPADKCLGDGGQCVDATGPTGNGLCPGVNGECIGCRCASPDTPIATPQGNRRIDELGIGDLVYSVDRGAVRAVPVAATRRTPVKHHVVVRVALATGSVIELSPAHPTADGRPFAALPAGGRLDGIGIVSAALVPYRHAATHDILPASDTGTYFAGGVLVGSTLAPFAPAESSVSAPVSVAQY